MQWQIAEFKERPVPEPIWPLWNSHGLFLDRTRATTTIFRPGPAWDLCSPLPGQVNNLAPLRTDILETFFDLQQVWRIFFMARAQIWDNFRRSSFGMWKTRVYLHRISDYSSGLGAPFRLESRTAVRLAVIWAVTVGKLMQLPAGVTRTNSSSGFVPPEWIYCNLFQPSTVIHF